MAEAGIEDKIARKIRPSARMRKVKRRIALHLSGWAALWAFWVFVSRHNHPNLTLDATASGLLVAAFAAAIYANHLWLIPRRRRGIYAGEILLAMGGLALACTVAIHVTYDVLWGPDSARFGFWTNLGLEFALVAFHVGLVAILVKVWSVSKRALGR